MSPLKSSPARARCQWMYAIPTQSGVMGNAAVGAGQRCLTFMLDEECFQGMPGSHIEADVTNPRFKKTHYGTTFESVSINVFMLLMSQRAV